MSIDFDNDKEEEVIPPLNKFIPRVITGGKGPPSSPDWLSNLNEGDIFLARHKNKAEINFELNKFRVILKSQSGKSVRLLVHRMDKSVLLSWVDTKTFSKEMIFQEVIGTIEDTDADEGE